MFKTSRAFVCAAAAEVDAARGVAATNNVETWNDIIEGLSCNSRDEPLIFADVSFFKIMNRLAVFYCAGG